ncbi:MAG: hypothetical protein CL916_07030 [Deltaproteobacteria bacterium]|nr:hypothetical protein [Deltaproteobacteria bacterium]
MTLKNILHLFCYGFSTVILLTSCTSRHVTYEKVHIARFHEINSQGLIGGVDSYRAVSYEFCIPRIEEYVRAVKNIEPNIGFQRSSGRIGCTKEEYLCIGHTNPNYKKTFTELVSLPYIKRIEESFFE